MARCYSGDKGGLDELHRGIELALDQGAVLGGHEVRLLERDVEIQHVSPLVSGHLSTLYSPEGGAPVPECQMWDPSKQKANV